VSKRVQAQLIAKYLLYELECLKVRRDQSVQEEHGSGRCGML